MFDSNGSGPSRITTILYSALLLTSIVAVVMLGRFLWLGGNTISALNSQSKAGTTILASLQSTATSLQNSADAVHTTLIGTHKNGDDGVLYISRNLLREIDQTSNVIRQSSIQERTGVKQLTTDSDGLLMAASTTITKLGSAVDSINLLTKHVDSSTLPALDASVASIGIATSTITLHADSMLDASTLTLNGATNSLTDLHNLLSDPSWHNTLFNVDQTTGNLNRTTAQIDTAVHNILNPKKSSLGVALAQTVGKIALSSAVGPLISHFWPIGVSISGTVPVNVVSGR